MDRLLNPKQFAKILNVKSGTVYSWLSRGVQLPPSVKIGGSTRWREEVVRKWIEQREKEGREAAKLRRLKGLLWKLLSRMGTSEVKNHE